METINAKKRFKEGYIMLNRPFQFAELKNPIQKMTIVWAYSERPKIHTELNEKGKAKLEDLEYGTNPLRFFTPEEKEEWISNEIDKVFADSKNKMEVYEGEIVQSIIDGQLCKFYPDEYKIIDKEKLHEILAEEGYHAVCSKGIEKIKDFGDKLHYLKSRGVSDHTAKKWAAVSFGEMVYYKPYFELLTMFCRDYEIYPDSFYEEVEGIVQTKQTFKDEKQRVIR